MIVGISFLPRLDYGAYPQMPIESITAEQYAKIKSGINYDSLKLDVNVREEEMTIEKYCDGDQCSISGSSSK